MMPSVTPTPGVPIKGGGVDTGIEKLLSSLDQLEVKAEGSRPDLLFLRTLLESPDFTSLMRMHEMVTTPENKDPPPTCENALDLIADVDTLLHYMTSTPEGDELSQILNNSHLLALLSAHDQIALKEYQPHLPVPTATDEEGEAGVKVVKLMRGSREPLGATIQMDESSQKIRIARVMKGGAADRSGLIFGGDQVLEVNDRDVSGKTPTDVVKMLSQSQGPITLKLIPGDVDGQENAEKELFMRALFDYDPQEDKYIPCREAGIGFRRGDILKIVSQDDPNWWQAIKLGDDTFGAGLIPGRQLQERKEVLKLEVHGQTNFMENRQYTVKNDSKFSPKLSRKNKRAKKSSQSEEMSSEGISTYEEVYQCCPDSAIRRTIVLIGPPGVGSTTLQSHLIGYKENCFKVPPVCTSRPRKADDDPSMIFLPRHEMERDILNKKYLEHWEHRGHLYGTALGQVKQLCEEGFTPVLTCSQPQLLHLIWNADVKPYCVLVKPPALPELRMTRKSTKAKHPAEDPRARTFTDDEFSKMVACSESMERSYAHYVSAILVNNDLQQAKEDLISIASRMGAEPQWIPSDWLDHKN